MKHSMKVPALFSLALALSAWGSAPVFIRLLRNAYDPYSQAFIRYFFAAVALVILCLIRHRQEFLGLLRRPGPLMGMACINIIHQVTWTLGCYRATAALAQLITQIGVVFVAILGYMLFREERHIIRSLSYLVGTAMSFVGVAIVLLAGRHTSAAIDPVTALLLLTVALCWAVYAVWAKHLVMNCHPVPLFAVLSIFITIGTGGLACVLGKPSCLVHAGAGTTLVAFVSGILPIATAHPSYHFAQKYLGSAFSSSCNLLSPLLTCLFAAFLLDDDPLTLPQWVGAAILLTGTLTVVYKKASPSPVVAESTN